MSAPVLHVTNWSSWSSKGLHGPGPKLTIMALPRSWEHGEGTVSALAPVAASLRAHQAGTMSIEAYRAEFEARLETILDALRPGVLDYLPTGASARVPVASGSTLCCACSRADAAAGHCHRAWAGAVLARAGWRVILDGVAVGEPPPSRALGSLFAQGTP